MADLLETFKRDLREQRLLSRGGRLVVAVSGGVDSMVLLDLLARAFPEPKKRLVVAHLNHGLRGRSSDADERLVRRTAAALGLRCVFRRADVRTQAKRSKQSIEMAAREIRHRFLAETARKVGAKHIATAHHADDQVELFFVRLLRGASPRGLAGMASQGVSPVAAGLKIIRPLLGFIKEQLLAYARARGIRYREDRTNQSPDFLRNRVRLELLPLLRRRFQPALNPVVLRLMEMLAAETELPEAAAVDWLRAKSRPAFAELAVAVQRAVIARQLHAAEVVADFALIEHLRTNPETPVSVGPGVALVQGSNGKVSRRLVTDEQFNAVEKRLDVTKSGRTTFAGAEFRWTRRKFRGLKRELAARQPGEELLNAALVGRVITLRLWRPGDRFQPAGFARSTKLQDWFVNRKVPRAKRHRLVLAEAAGGVLCWVEAQRLAEPFKLNEGTREVLVWRWRRV